MIRTATQLKAKIRNLSGGDNDRARVLIRNFVMERFLERVALSPYRNNFILQTAEIRLSCHQRKTCDNGAFSPLWRDLGGSSHGQDDGKSMGEISEGELFRR